MTEPPKTDQQSTETEHLASQAAGGRSPADHPGEEPDPTPPGVYLIDEEGTPTRLGPGTWEVDAAGMPRQALPLGRLVEKLDVEKLQGSLDRWLGNRVGERKTYAVGRYVLAAAIVGCATTLAILGKIQGEAIVGFLGAAIGYVLARGTPR